MKINKYINAFIATAIMAAGFASCTNDDTVDSKSLYVISLNTSGLNEEQQAAFDKVLKSKTFGVDVIDAHQQTYGLRSSEAYARARFQEVLASNVVLDSIVNVYADQYNNTDFAVNVVLKNEAEAVLQTSEAIKPTVQKEAYTITVDQTVGSLDADRLAKMEQMTEQVLGIAPNSFKDITSTPGYVTTQYLSTLATQLFDSISTLVPEKGAPNIYEDFSEKITVKKGSAEVGSIVVAPAANYTAWFDITEGSLTADEKAELYGDIKQEIFNGMDAYPWGKDKKFDNVKASIAYNNLMITSHNAIQTIVNNFAAKVDKTDFTLNFHMSVADGATAPVAHEWKEFTELKQEFKANIVKGNYKVEYQITQGSLSESNMAKVVEAMESLMYPELNDFYLSVAKEAFAGFQGSPTNFVDAETGNPVNVNGIAQYLAKKTKTLDFIITLKLVDAKGNTYDKVILKANEGWNTGK